MAQANLKITKAPAVADPKILESIIKRIQAHAMTMIYLANHRDDAEKGDPKVGGHPSACSSALHILSCLHLAARQPQDFIANKPHASPTDHTNHYMMKLLYENDFTRMSDERARLAMKNLRHYSHNGEPVFQSYHSAWDPDHWHFLPSGSVGIPPVNALYLAEAWKMAEKHGLAIPEDTHFWCIMGDSEYREGSLMEALPEASERAVGNLTWIVDYNRQSLDGHRVLNEVGLGGKDCDRIERTAQANGWDTLQLRHGRYRKQIIADAKEGEALQNVLENALPDYELQALLAKKDPKEMVEAIAKYDKAASKILDGLEGKDVIRFMRDLGGHDVEELLEAYDFTRKNTEKPTLIIAHTLKGWGLECEAQSANHSALVGEEEVRALRKSTGIENDDLLSFPLYEESTEEGKYLAKRGDWFWKGMEKIHDFTQKNLENFKKEVTNVKMDTDFPNTLDINLKFVPMIHTQWMLGQITAKLNRIADTYEEGEKKEEKKELTPEEKRWVPVANQLVTLAPDVGTSTNLNASMDGRVFAPDMEDYETEYGSKDDKAPNITPKEAETSRHLRFEIAEANAMSCLGSFGKVGELLGYPMLPIMTVYDFFIKRALDQLFFNAYWKSHFILVGTPSGVSLSPEGAQHSWKSDIQIANIITWEPAYALEFEWVFVESVRRHIKRFIDGVETDDNTLDRGGVLIRGVTRGLVQKEMLTRLKKHQRFAGKKDEEILEATRQDCLNGGWYIVDHRGTPGYNPGENVVNIFSMGCMVTEALKASDELVKQGIFANVIQVSSPDLLCGNLAEKTGYKHLRQTLGVRGDLYLKVNPQSSNGNGHSNYPPTQFGPKPSSISQLMTLGGRRVPIVSIHDGEVGLLDNLGSVTGTLQKALAVKKHSKSGRPADIYQYQHIDSVSVVEATKQVLEDCAVTGTEIDASAAISIMQGPSLNA